MAFVVDLWGKIAATLTIDVTCVRRLKNAIKRQERSAGQIALYVSPAGRLCGINCLV